MGCRDGELSILIVDDAQIAELNEQYLGRSGPTNVLAFPMDTASAPEPIPRLLGDVVISVETAEREGEMGDIAMERRLSQLLIHGILHLLDYDHVASASEARKMEEKGLELEKLLQAETAYADKTGDNRQ